MEFVLCSKKHLLISPKKIITNIDFIMMTRILIMLIAFIMMVYGLTYIIIYINLFTFGYTIKEYIIFILGQKECWLYIIGLLMQIILLYTWKGKR